MPAVRCSLALLTWGAEGVVAAAGSVGRGVRAPAHVGGVRVGSLRAALEDALPIRGGGGELTRERIKTLCKESPSDWQTQKLGSEQ